MHKHTCTRFLIQPSRFRQSFPVSCKVFYMNLSPCFFGNYLSIICSIPPEFSHQAMETVVQFVDRACLSPGSSGSFVQVSRGNRKSHFHVQGFPQTCITSLSKSSCCWQYLASTKPLLPSVNLQKRIERRPPGCTFLLFTVRPWISSQRRKKRNLSPKHMSLRALMAGPFLVSAKNCNVEINGFVLFSMMISVRKNWAQGISLRDWALVSCDFSESQFPFWEMGNQSHGLVLKAPLAEYTYLYYTDEDTNISGCKKSSVHWKVLYKLVINITVYLKLLGRSPPLLISTSSM